jgi:hypothetical protein
MKKTRSALALAMALVAMGWLPALAAPEPAALPFNLEQVVNYFQDALGKPPAQTHGRAYLFVEGDGRGESMMIAVSGTRRQLAVVLAATGDWGVSTFKEFFEAPFFRRSESEQFYRLLYANPPPRSEALERFRVKVGAFERPGWTIIRLDFSPPAPDRNLKP